MRDNIDSLFSLPESEALLPLSFKESQEKEAGETTLLYESEFSEVPMTEATKKGL